MKISGYDGGIEEAFVDFIKKFNVHEISLLRNIQYDIDNMIKKTGIFNYQSHPEFQEKLSLKGLDLIPLALDDPWAGLKAKIAQEGPLTAQEYLPVDREIVVKLKEQLESKQEGEGALMSLKNNYF